MSQGCEFESLRDRLIHDCLMTGVLDTATRGQLLREDCKKLDLQKAIELCKAKEAADKETKEMATTEENLPESGLEVYHLRTVPWKVQSTDTEKARKPFQMCTRCGSTHTRGKSCPTLGKECH